MFLSKRKEGRKARERGGAEGRLVKMLLNSRISDTAGWQWSGTLENMTEKENFYKLLFLLITVTYANSFCFMPDYYAK